MIMFGVSKEVQAVCDSPDLHRRFRTVFLFRQENQLDSAVLKLGKADDEATSRQKNAVQQISKFVVL